MSFLLGLLVGSFLLEPIVINYIYMSDVDLFNDIILTKKNSKKLHEYYLLKIINFKKGS